MNTNLIEKIKKLLALGTSPNQAESELALAKARQLAVENDIDFASLNAFETKESYNKDSINMGQRLPVAQVHVNRLLINHFKVRVIYSGTRDFGRQIILIGTPTDIEMAKFVNSFLLNEFMMRWRAYQLKLDASTLKRASFLYGMERGLDQKLEDAKAAVEAEKLNDSNRQNYGLMVISREKQLENAVGNFFPKLTKIKHKSKSLDAESYHSGRKEGQNINIARPIAGSRAKLIN